MHMMARSQHKSPDTSSGIITAETCRFLDENELFIRLKLCRLTVFNRTFQTRQSHSVQELDFPYLTEVEGSTQVSDVPTLSAKHPTLDTSSGIISITSPVFFSGRAFPTTTSHDDPTTDPNSNFNIKSVVQV